MSKAEQFIKDYTNQCSNVVTAGEGKSTLYEYHEWITPEQALRAIEIEREEMIEKACEYLQEHLVDYWSQGVTDESKFIDEFRKYMEK